MRYYKHLYLMEGLRRRKARIIRKLEENKFQANIHIITLSQNEEGTTWRSIIRAASAAGLSP